MTVVTTFVLRLKNTTDGTYAVSEMDLPSDMTLEEATEAAISDLDDGLLLERITNADTKASMSLQSIARAPKGFGS